MSSHTFKAGDEVAHSHGKDMGKVEGTNIRPDRVFVRWVSGLCGWHPTSDLMRVYAAPENNPAPSPIRTVKQIVPGWYGIVSVHRNPDGSIDVDVEQDGVTASQLRAAAKVFAELADALDEQGDQ